MNKYRFTPALVALALCVTSIAAGVLPLMFSGKLIAFCGGDPDLTEVFAQLEHARIVPHVLVPVLLFAAFALLLYRFPARGKRIAGYILLGAALWLVSAAGVLLLTKVNSVRVLYLLDVFVPLIRNGLLNLL